MSNNPAAPHHKWSAFNVAAWTSVLVPFATFGVTVAISSLLGHTSLLPQPSRQFFGDMHCAALLVNLGSIFLGVFSLFGIRKHGVAFILWRAILGILAGGIFGFYDFASMMMSSIIC